jgi:hypothetical protein
MNLIAGVIVASIGLLLAILSIAGILPGLTQTGVIMILFGGLIIGMSFINRVPPQEGEVMSTPATLLNIFVSPAETFQALRRNPRWLAAAVIIALLGTIYSGLFINRVTPERVANESIDRALKMSFLNDEARKQIEAGRPQAIADMKDPIKRAGGVVTGFIGQVVWYAFLGLLFFLVVLAFGGSIYYWQAFAVAVYASFPVAVIRFLLNTLVLYLKDPVDIHPIMGQSSLIQDNLSFLVSSADSPVIYTLLATLSLLMFYWVWLIAVGLKNGGDKVSSSTGWSAALVTYGLIVVFALSMALLFPSFIA